MTREVAGSNPVCHAGGLTLEECCRNTLALPFFAMPSDAQAVRSEAAAIIRRIVRLLPLRPTMAAYLVGQADALDPDGAESAGTDAQ